MNNLLINLKIIILRIGFVNKILMKAHRPLFRKVKHASWINIM